MPDVAEIAGRLSEAQRECVRTMSKHQAGRLARLVPDDMPPGIVELIKHPGPVPLLRLTRLGVRLREHIRAQDLAVRAYLENSHD